MAKRGLPKGETTKGLRDYHKELEKEKHTEKFTYDILGNKVFQGDYVVFLDSSFGKSCLNIALIQDIGTNGYIIIKNMGIKNGFLLYRRNLIPESVKKTLRDDLDCMRMNINNYEINFNKKKK